MPTRLNRDAYQRLIDEDLEWLGQQPPSLEREHIFDVLRYSVELCYPNVSVVDYIKGMLADGAGVIDTVLAVRGRYNLTLTDTKVLLDAARGHHANCEALAGELEQQ